MIMAVFRKTGREYNVRIKYDEDCDYIYLYNCDNHMKYSYDGREEMEREWEIRR